MPTANEKVVPKGPPTSLSVTPPAVTLTAIGKPMPALTSMTKRSLSRNLYPATPVTPSARPLKSVPPSLPRRVANEA